MTVRPLLLVNGFDEGGTERQALQLARQLSESGRVRVYLATLKAAGELTPLVRQLELGAVPENGVRDHRDVGGAFVERSQRRDLSSGDEIAQLFKIVELIQQPIIKIVEFIEDASKKGYPTVTKAKQLFAKEQPNEESVCTCLKELIQVTSFYFNLI